MSYLPSPVTKQIINGLLERNFWHPSGISGQAAVIANQHGDVIRAEKGGILDDADRRLCAIDECVNEGPDRKLSSGADVVRLS